MFIRGEGVDVGGLGGVSVFHPVGKKKRSGIKLLMAKTECCILKAPIIVCKREQPFCHCCAVTVRAVLFHSPIIPMSERFDGDY